MEKVMTNNNNVTVKMPREMIRLMDDLVQGQWYPSRGEIIRDCIRSQFKECFRDE
jgi:Arc/MetJ-type ribon-helix-helix transcriptional regulator